MSALTRNPRFRDGLQCVENDTRTVRLNVRKRVDISGGIDIVRMIRVRVTRTENENNREAYRVRKNPAEPTGPPNLLNL